MSKYVSIALLTLLLSLIIGFGLAMLIGSYAAIALVGVGLVSFIIAQLFYVIELLKKKG
ncbi:hypothetical protein [Mangrovibacillus cuniculi]|uniref:Uncharacterized protein n=1 Tax=Mangrovibacillus cuniculi TaxID=2593652 RepID=A0A7S8CE16_9BACI|nr:hypothetical protein [Mangrovibacillus cuniculi]QPC48258.1 hypothetical protein G8O30_15690 [Mangrovibacillus cuniculi]